MTLTTLSSICRCNTTTWPWSTIARSPRLWPDCRLPNCSSQQRLYGMTGRAARIVVVSHNGHIENGHWREIRPAHNPSGNPEVTRTTEGRTMNIERTIAAALMYAWMKRMRTIMHISFKLEDTKTRCSVGKRLTIRVVTALLEARRHILSSLYPTVVCCVKTI